MTDLPENKKISMNMIIDKTREKSYFEVPFEVPSNAAKIEVFYAYARMNRRQDENGDEYQDEINIIDLGIRDEGGNFRGASGSERLNFYITENEATPGYIQGVINAGTWAVVLGAYKIQASGCKVEINVVITLKEKVLLRGDLHMHSTHSDGKYGVDDVIKMARLHNLDYIFLTDHNTYSQNDCITSSDSLVVMPGMEWTHYNGHSNFLGVKRPIHNFISNDKETTVKIMHEAQENGAFVVLNHPFCRFCPWEWGFDVPYDAVEIWNGPIKDADYDAIRWWDSCLAKGKRVPAVGGSDSHKNELFRMVGTPTTFVYSDSRGQSDILRALRDGHAFISYTPDGPSIDLSVGDVIMGGCITYKDGQKGHAAISRVLTGDKIRLISDKGLETEVAVDGQSIKTLDFEIEKRKYYRVEVWRELLPNLNTLAAISNPIYVQS